jgi:hypothetical protein
LPAGLLRGPAPLATVHLRERALAPAALRVVQCMQKAGRAISPSCKKIARTRGVNCGKM